MLQSGLQREDAERELKGLVEALYRDIPSGVGSKSGFRLDRADFDRMLRDGARWAVSRGMGSEEDIDRTESGGAIDGADPDAASDKAYERGRSQLGTLGSGNHFLEIQYVDEIYDDAAAAAFGLEKGQVTVMIHTGSRGFGHQVCTDSIEEMGRATLKYGIRLRDRELACAPLGTPEAERYLAGMRAAANYAWANRQVITHWVREAMMRALHVGPRELGLRMVYDVSHNIAKEELHESEGKARRLMVHRKGATRAFPAGHPELPDAYRNAGQPVLIPGDMGRASYVLVGTERAMKETWGSTSHGAGRVMSRHEAIKKARGRAIWRELADSGIIVMAGGRGTLAEEMPEAYKDVSQVVSVVESAGISRRVARLRPMGVVKG